MPVSKRNRIGRTGRRDTGKDPQVPQRLGRELHERRIILVSDLRQDDRRGEHMVGHQSRIDGEHASETGEEQTGAIEQNEGKCHLRHDEPTPQQLRAAAARASSSLFAQDCREIDAAQAHDGNQAEDDANRRHDRHRVRADGAVDPNLVPPGQILNVERGEQPERREADQ